MSKVYLDTGDKMMDFGHKIDLTVNHRTASLIKEKHELFIKYYCDKFKKAKLLNNDIFSDNNVASDFKLAVDNFRLIEKLGKTLTEDSGEIKSSTGESIKITPQTEKKLTK